MPININDPEYTKAEKDFHDAFDEWEKRNKYKWKLDISVTELLLKDEKEKPWGI